jgi:RHS repeat-associated protein
VFGYDQDFLPTRTVLPTSPALEVSRTFPATHITSGISYSNATIQAQLGADQPLSVRRWTGGAAQTYYVASEAPGSVAGLIDTVGGLEAHYTYAPFGTLVDSAGAVSNILRFAAREYDGETGLYYNRARYYDPTVGRFVSEDPIGLAGGVNEYAYAGNDPVNATDPSGTCTITYHWSMWSDGTDFTIDAVTSEGCDGGGGGGGGARGGGGGGAGPSGPATAPADPKAPFRSCVASSTATNFRTTFDGLPQGLKNGGTFLAGVAAGRTAQATSSAYLTTVRYLDHALAKEAFDPAIYSQVAPPLISPAVYRGTIFGAEFVAGSAGEGALALVGANLVQTVAIQIAFGIGVEIGSLANAVGSCWQ